jgi:hypothetical protein
VESTVGADKAVQISANPVDNFNVVAEGTVEKPVEMEVAVNSKPELAVKDEPTDKDVEEPKTLEPSDNFNVDTECVPYSC